MLQVHAVTVVADRDLQQTGMVARSQCNQAFIVLARGASLLWLFDAMVQRIAQQMHQRCVQLLQDVAIDLRGFAVDLQPYLFT